MKLLSTLSAIAVAASATEFKPYSFTNPVADGSSYRFSSVSSGIDALVTFNPFDGTTIAVEEVDVTSMGTGAGFQPKLDGVPQGATQMMGVQVDFVAAGGNTAVSNPVRVCFVDVDGRAPGSSGNAGAREIVQLVNPQPNTWSVEADTFLTVKDNPVQFFGKMAVEPGISTGATRALACASYSSTSSLSFNLGIERGSANTADPFRLFSANFYEPITFTSEVNDVEDITSTEDVVPDIDEYVADAPVTGKQICDSADGTTVIRCDDNDYCQKNVQTGRNKWVTVEDKGAGSCQKCGAVAATLSTSDGTFKCDGTGVSYNGNNDSVTTTVTWDCDCQK